MQKQFKYIYNNQEVSKEEFEKLAGDSFKWFDGDSIVYVPFSSFDSFLTGDFKSRRQINDHIKQVLDLPTIDCKFTMCGQKDCKCCYPQQKNTNSTRHKSQAGETHTENKVFFIPPNFTGWFFDNEDRPDIKNFDTIKDAENYFYKSKNTIGRIFKDKEIVKEFKKEDKDDVITSSNRGEKEAIEHFANVKGEVAYDYTVGNQEIQVVEWINKVTREKDRKSVV